MSLDVQEFKESNQQEWDDFVNRHPEGRFSQLIGYKDVIERTYGYKAAYWLFRRPGGGIAIIFPAFVKKSLLLGSKLVSQPFCEYGGLLGADLDEDDRLLIKHKLSDLVRLYRVPFLEVHGGIGLPQHDMEGILSMKPLHQYAVLRLSSPNDIWAKMDRMVRKAVRKAERSSLECYLEITDESIKNDFYPLYLRNMKRFGTPPHPLSFFLNCRRYLSQHMKLFTVRYQGEAIAVLLGFTTGKRVHIVVNASDEKHWDKRPNDLVHWEFIKWAADNGYEFFDFGPVRYTGQKQFKEKWGVDLFDYSYFYLLRSRAEPPKIATYSLRARLAASAWRRLVPLPLTRLIGPWCRGQVGD